ncbi:ATP-binding cassette sub-family G member 1 [Eumeta japonica]|uniref:ATP-binding cassette sub-family G member 1 n=1 Tax=Eumeta variegata TaxID=151549 RepID=A0A4C2A2L8_EUMVA|nr:ATP-binding cassette sub-family G member 1 [Eumeta japonica]
MQPWTEGVRIMNKVLNKLHLYFLRNRLQLSLGRGEWDTASSAFVVVICDVLSSYCRTPCSGVVTVNGRRRNEKWFRRRSCYIMQNDMLHEFLTVRESLALAADLKLGNHLRRSQKNQRIEEIIVALGLSGVRHTRTGSLSGGQKKRLAVALELLSDPPIMFLDEPTSARQTTNNLRTLNIEILAHPPYSADLTPYEFYLFLKIKFKDSSSDNEKAVAPYEKTVQNASGSPFGLDISSTKHLMYLLRELARQGRTLVVTVHQPSAPLLALVDRLYAVKDGCCAYIGSVPQLVPYLDSINLSCPPYHNPVDFLIEICAGAQGSDTSQQLVHESVNGKAITWIDNSKLDDFDFIIDNSILCDDLKLTTLPPPKAREKNGASERTYATSHWTQFCILTYTALSMSHQWVIRLSGRNNISGGGEFRDGDWDDLEGSRKDDHDRGSALPGGNFDKLLVLQHRQGRRHNNGQLPLSMLQSNVHYVYRLQRSHHLL